jgi:topoisomerase IV subunit A
LIILKQPSVAVANEKLYVNRTEGFAGTGLKKDEYVCDCSDIDDIIVFSARRYLPGHQGY